MHAAPFPFDADVNVALGIKSSFASQKPDDPCGLETTLTARRCLWSR